MNRRVLVPWIALAAVVVVAVAVLVARSEPDDSVGARSTRIARQLKCPACEGESVADSNTQLARDMRAEIRRRVAAGETDDAIIAYYVDRYPDTSLRPDGDGIGFLVWGIPVIVIVLALGGLGLALRRWSRQPRLAANADDERLVERARGEPAP
jgi:cytochrome c-type biogenesis protein CcmH